MSVVSGMGSMTSQFSMFLILSPFFVRHRCAEKIYNLFQKIPKFEIKMNLRGLQHLGCSNLSCIIVVGCFKKSDVGILKILGRFLVQNPKYVKNHKIWT